MRRTALRADEYRRNFRQIDADVIAAVTSKEADLVTPLMSKIYLRLAAAPAELWEREGVLYFAAREADGRLLKASKVLYELLGVASATAHKALQWMHGQGIIGYFAGKNGAGIRIFLNRASDSIGLRAPAAGKKILPFARGSNVEKAGSAGEPAFSDSYAVSEVLEKNLNPRAPKNGAETGPVVKTTSVVSRSEARTACTPPHSERREARGDEPASGAAPMQEVVERLKAELGPCVREAAARVAAQTVAGELERTRQWFETKALPKAVRVAQHEAYDLLRKHGTLDGGRGRRAAGLEVGRGAGDTHNAAARPLTPEEIRETAESCVALLEAQGKSVEATLSEISLEAGGWLLPEDTRRVRETARAMLRGGGEPAARP